MSDDFALTEPKQKAKAAVSRCIEAYTVAFVRRFNAAEYAKAWLSDPRGEVFKPLTIKADGTYGAWVTVERDEMVLPMIDGGKDGALIKKMIASWGEQAVGQLCAEFPSMTDARVTRSDYSIGALYAASRHLMLRGQNLTDTRQAKNREAVSRATGGGR